MPEGWNPNGNDNPYAAPVAMIAPPRRRDDGLLAARSTRFVARLVDNLLFGLSGVPVALAFWLTDGAWVGVAAGVVPLGLVAYQCYLVATTGQSVAKRGLGLRIVRLDGSPVGFVAGVVTREWVLFALGCVPGLGLLLRLVDAILIFGEERRCLHDHFSGTKVVLASASP